MTAQLGLDYEREQRARDEILEGLSNREINRRRFKIIEAQLRKSVIHKMDFQGAKLAYITADNVAAIIRDECWERGNWIGSFFRIYLPNQGWQQAVTIIDYHSGQVGSHGNKLAAWTLTRFADAVAEANPVAA